MNTVPPAFDFSFPLPAGYEYLALLGKGGMGTVVQARQLAGGRVVALKYLHLTVAGLRERFLREGRVSTQLVHPNIVQGLGIEFVDDTPVLVFEYVKGVDLRALIEKERRLPVPRALALVKQLLAGLGCAHQAGVVHRDLKSANVLVTENDIAKLGDFGTAGLREAHEQLTKTGMLMGTPSYMAPEQARGQRVDARADIYAAGVILFELLTGTLPLKAPTPLALLAKIDSEVPPLATDIVREIPAHLAEVIDRCLKKHPEQRPPSAEALVAALEAAPGARRAARTLKNIPILQDPVDGATLAGAPVSAGPLPDDAAAGRPHDGSIPPRSRVTGRVRTITGSTPIAAPPPSRLTWVLAGAGGALLCALVAFGVYRSLTPAQPPPVVPTVAVARPITVFNDRDHRYVTRIEGQLALAFETDMKEPLRATLISGGDEVELDPWPEHSTPARQTQTFHAPADRCLDNFDVRLSRADGLPLAGGMLHHPGLSKVVKEWHPRLAAEPRAKPVVDRWALALDRLAGAIGSPAERDSFAKLAARSPRPDLKRVQALLDPTAKRAKDVLASLLAAVPAVLDAPLSKVTPEDKRIAYDTLMPVRLLDRALASAGKTTLKLHADAALGRRFGLGASVAPSAVTTKHEIFVGITSLGFLEKGAALREMLMMTGSTPPQTYESWPLRTRLFGLKQSPDALARIDLECRKWQGEPQALMKDELVWVELEDQKWTLLFHDGAMLPEPVDPKRQQYRSYAHGLDPALLAPQMRLRLTREVLPSDADHDRRVTSVMITKMHVRCGPAKR